jgi:hypothetical protein
MVNVIRKGIPSPVGFKEDGSVLWDYEAPVGHRKDGSAIAPIGGAADGIYYVDRRLPHGTADYGNITMLTTQLQMWAVGATSPTILPANYWTVGKSIRLTANIKWTAVANTNNITIGMCYGAAAAPAAIVVSSAMAATSSTTVFDVFIEGYATCRSIGTAGTLSMFGVAHVPVALIASTVQTGVNFPSAGVTVVSTIDTTVGTNALSFTAARAVAAGDTMAATDIFMEALN